MWVRRVVLHGDDLAFLRRPRLGVRHVGPLRVQDSDLLPRAPHAVQLDLLGPDERELLLPPDLELPLLAEGPEPAARRFPSRSSLPQSNGKRSYRQTIFEDSGLQSLRA